MDDVAREGEDWRLAAIFGAGCGTRLWQRCGTDVARDVAQIWHEWAREVAQDVHEMWHEMWRKIWHEMWHEMWRKMWHGNEMCTRCGMARDWHEM